MPEANQTEKATPRRRQQAREQGMVVRSRELTSTIAMTSMVAMLMFVGHDAAQHWTTLYRMLLDDSISEGIDANGPVLFWTTVEALRWMVPVLVGALVISLAVNHVQGGITFAPAALQPSFGRMNPASRLGQIFSPAGLSNLGRSLLPFGAIAWIGVSALSGAWTQLERASFENLPGIAAFVGRTALSIGWRCALVLLVWSGAEYGLNWIKAEADMRMSHEELKEEGKQTEGSPVIKTRIRRVQRQMHRKFMKAAAKTATVVVTNPTHYAVALRYEQDMAAPIVVAKGVDFLALEIRAIAAEHNIPVMENRPLAQALYKSVEIGDSIPSALYQAVADLLVLVYRAQAELRAAEARRRSRNASGQQVGQQIGAMPQAANPQTGNQQGRSY